MKSNPIGLRIDEPCNENWASMTPNEQGRYCDSCQKSVIDFTHLTDNEILKMISANPNGLCGQFRESQLNRKVVETKLSGKNSKLNALVAGIMVATGAGTVSAQSTDTTTYHPIVVIDEKHPTGPVCIRTITNETREVVVNVIVMDSLNNIPLRNAFVYLPGSDVRVVTDSTGHATLTIPDSLANETITVMVQRSGFERKTISVDSSVRSSTPFIVQLIEEERKFMGKPAFYKPE